MNILSSMLKIFCGLVSILSVLIGSAYVTPTYASSTNLELETVLAGTYNGETEEYIVVRNLTSKSVDVSGWCVSSSSSGKFACIPDHRPLNYAVLAPYEKVLIVSSLHASLYGNYHDYAIVYDNNSLEGKISRNNEKVSLLSSDNQEVDSIGWSNFASYWHHLQRKDARGFHDAKKPVEPGMDGWAYSDIMLPYDTGIYYSDGLAEGFSELIYDLRLSEILPNPKGSDDNAEYIELYNQSDYTISLDDYLIRYGRNLEHKIQLPSTDLSPSEYMLITNEIYSPNLLNSNNKVALLYILQSGEEVKVDETEYGDAKDDTVWVYMQEGWVFSKDMTPGVPNYIIESAEDGQSDLVENEDSSTTTLKPCAEGKYRHPVTNRCRNIESTAGTSNLKTCAEGQYRHPETNRCRKIQNATTGSKLTSCKEGQYRNSETNRCRKIDSGTTKVPCKEGQERNADTGRCRNIKKISEVDGAVKGVQSRADGMNIYLIIVVIAVAVAGLAYGIWEWRQEIKNLWGKIVSGVRKK